MNQPLIDEFVKRAAKAPVGQKMNVFAALVAERCALICEIDPKHASETIRGAFVPKSPELTKAAGAAIEATR